MLTFVLDQINVGKLDPVSGTFTGESDVYALAGYLRGRVRDKKIEIESERHPFFCFPERDGSLPALNF